MREIKFRAWDKQDKKMREVLGYHISANKVIVSNKPYGNVSLWDFDLMQYTGLKDKNGKEIYEGDILCWPHFEGKKNQTRWAVEWDQSKAAYGYWHPREIAEVIGNIYENPELLEAK